MSLYEEKDKAYFSTLRKDMISLLGDKNYNEVLEIGAGSGAGLIYLLENNIAKSVSGIDITKLEGSPQEDKRIKNFWIGDIEKEDINIQDESFDCIICADVLEHLVDPWKTMKVINKWLKPGGLFLLSIPNIREVSTFRQIYLKGSFEYKPEGGILDRTHLRFFCRKDAVDLVAQSGLKVQSALSNFQTVHEKSWRTHFNAMTFRLFEEFLTVQHFIIAHKK